MSYLKHTRTPQAAPSQMEQLEAEFFLRYDSGQGTTRFFWIESMSAKRAKPRIIVPSENLPTEEFPGLYALLDEVAAIGSLHEVLSLHAQEDDYLVAGVEYLYSPSVSSEPVLFDSTLQRANALPGAIRTLTLQALIQQQHRFLRDGMSVASSKSILERIEQNARDAGPIERDMEAVLADHVLTNLQHQAELISMRMDDRSRPLFRETEERIQALVAAAQSAPRIRSLADVVAWEGSVQHTLEDSQEPAL